MHIHQGHWSLSSSVWWTRLCNNSLIYILSSIAISVDYGGAGLHVCAYISRSIVAKTLHNWLAVQVHVGSVSVRLKIPPSLSFMIAVDGYLPLPLFLSLSGGHVLAWLPPRNSPGLPGCSAFPAVSAGQSLKAVRCDDTDWQLGSGARGYQSSLSRIRGSTAAIAIIKPSIH